MATIIKTSQKQDVLDYLDRNGSITQRQATRDLGVMRLASRINDLRNEGYDIETEMIPVRSRRGQVHVALYRIKATRSEAL